MDYYALLDELVDQMSSLEDFDIPKIYETMGKLCILLRASKGVTTFYASPEQERLGRGEAFVCYDSGEEHQLVTRERVVTPTGMTVTCEVYIAAGAEPWTPLERERIQRIQRIMLTFLNRSRLSAEVERLTFFDGDGYHNVRYFTQQIARSGGLRGMVAARFNLWHFSVLNEQLGRECGNRLMRNYIRALEEASGEGGLVCRLGGDNFVLLCTAASLDQVTGMLKGHPVVYDEETDGRAVVSATAGIFRIPDGLADPNIIMGRITGAFESAKTAGREGLAFCDEELEDERERVKRVQQMFPIALKQGEFLVYYQPKVDVFDGCISGAEALCRWRHEGRLVPPIEFIPILERTLEICRLDFHMLDSVCRDIRRWLDEGRRPVRVSVNFSRRHMVNADLLERIIEVVDRNNVPHDLIEIELTETTTDVEFKDLKKVVNGLREAGISASVDDFGVGFSSLNLLREIPWNVLKLDKSLLPDDADDEGNEKSGIMFKHVVSMAREMGLECVAEGVETERQVGILRDNCCSIAQGFYYDKPLPVEEFEQRLG